MLSPLCKSPAILVPALALVRLVPTYPTHLEQACVGTTGDFTTEPTSAPSPVLGQETPRPVVDGDQHHWSKESKSPIFL